MRKATSLAIGLLLLTSGAVKADEPRAVPLTRPEMKQFLEDMKSRKPWIPLPELTEDEKAKLGEPRGQLRESPPHQLPARSAGRLLADQEAGKSRRHGGRQGRCDRERASGCAPAWVVATVTPRLCRLDQAPSRLTVFWIVSWTLGE